MTAASEWARRAWTPRTLTERIGLAGMGMLSTALACADVLLAQTFSLWLLFTVVETVAVLPWAVWMFLAADGPSGRSSRVAHYGIVLLVVACLVIKWTLIVPGDGFQYTYQTYTVAAYCLVMLGLVGRGRRLGHALLTLSDQPARLVSLSFVIPALAGALLLSLPVASRSGSPVSFLDALFVATSAVCVTGLTVHEVSTTYSAVGQAIIFVLFQVGALGIMALSAGIVVIAGRRMRVRSQAALAEIVDAASLRDLRRMVVRIAVFSLFLETVGALGLLPSFLSVPHLSTGQAVWYAVFHAVSAFGNAGFALTEGSLQSFSGTWSFLVVVMALIVLGGLGFPVLEELFERARTRLRGKRPRNLTLHSRVTLAASATLIGVMAAVFAALEWKGQLAGFSLDEKLLAALFQSVTMRTAGFSTVDISALGPATMALTCMAMFIGAAPGSTGGGVKVTTAVVVLATFRAELRGHAETSLAGRTLSQATIRKALTVAGLGVATVFFLAVGLLWFEPTRPLTAFFEVVSAFGTVGLSAGRTPELTAQGRLLVIATMLIGRVGPLTVALAVGARQRPPAVSFPEERVSIG